MKHTQNPALLTFIQ